MTIASEITALQTNLSAAKTAVTTKGGTVGDTGLAGLASEIATIPSGSAGSWGTVTYLDSNDQERTVTIQNEDEYYLLCKYGSDITIGGETFNLERITKVDLGTYATFTDTGFLRNCTLLTSITGVEHLVSVSNNFLSGCTLLNCVLNFEMLHNCGGNFLYNCSSLNSEVTLPNISSIANFFMAGCTSFAQTMTFRSELTFIGNNIFNDAKSLNHIVCNCNPDVIGTSAYSFSTPDNTAPMYTTGITVTGTYASEFKAKFPDSSSSPYRKIIVGS